MPQYTLKKNVLQWRQGLFKEQLNQNMWIKVCNAMLMKSNLLKRSQNFEKGTQKFAKVCGKGIPAW
jgi:chitinase